MDPTVCQAPIRSVRQYRATSGEIQGTNNEEIVANLESACEQFRLSVQASTPNDGER